MHQFRFHSIPGFSIPSPIVLLTKLYRAKSMSQVYGCFDNNTLHPATALNIGIIFPQNTLYYVLVHGAGPAEPVWLLRPWPDKF